MKSLLLLPVLWLGAACASNEPQDVPFDSSAGLVQIDVGGDGFVRCDGRRVPWEASVLELRQRTRAMDADALQRFVVEVRVDGAADDAGAEARAMQSRDRLLEALVVMGVAQAKVSR
jgi:hypothetical protein